LGDNFLGNEIKRKTTKNTKRQATEN